MNTFEAASLSKINLRRFAYERAGDLKHPPDWIRSDLGSKAERIATARSYLKNPINYILITPDKVVRDGNLRLEGILDDTGPETPVPVCITDEEITPQVSIEIMLETAEHTKSLTPYERFVGYSNWRQITGASAKDLAQKINLSEGAVSHIMSLGKCIPAVHEAAMAGKIGIADWLAISESPDQEVTLNLKLGGASAKELARHNKVSKQKSSAVRAAKITCPMGGRVVTIKGESSLEESIDLLGDVIKSMKQAIAKGLSAKTYQASLKDMAATGD